MTREEIQNKMTELSNEIAKVSCEILKLEDCAACKFELSIINIMGMCNMNIHTATSEPGDATKMKDAVAELIEKVRADGGMPITPDEPEEKLDAESMVEDLLNMNRRKD